MLGDVICAIMEEKYGEFLFKKKDLEIDLGDGTRYFVNPEKDVCLYKITYRPDGEGEEFYMHKTQSHGMQYYKLHFSDGSAKFQGVKKEHIEEALKDEELKHDTVITREQLELLEKYGIKLASHF
jgi:hypothetical protein